MKPTPQLSQNRNSRFPLTDYNYQLTGDAKASCSNVFPTTKSPSFHRLSSEFFGAEAYRDYLAHFFVFTVLALITAWPIYSSIMAVIGMARY